MYFVGYHSHTHRPCLLFNVQPTHAHIIVEKVVNVSPKLNDAADTMVDDSDDDR